MDNHRRSIRGKSGNRFETTDECEDYDCLLPFIIEDKTRVRGNI